MKKFLKVLLVLILVVVVFVGVTVIKMKRQLDQIDTTPVDVTTVADGVYEGESETNLVKVTVRVTVANGAISNVELLRHECGKGTPANSIIDTIIEGNNVEVDGVSGATVSSEVIKDAIRKALRKGK